MTDFGSPPPLTGEALWGGPVTPKSYDSVAPLRRQDVPCFAPAVGLTQKIKAQHDEESRISEAYKGMQHAAKR